MAYGISLFGIIFEYWSFKYLLLRKHSFPHQISGDLVKSVFALVPWAVLFYSFVNFIFTYFLNEVERELSFYWMSFLVVYNFFPAQLLTKCNKKLELSSWESEETYDRVSMNFVMDYDKVNPFTASQALNSFIKKMLDEGVVDSSEFKSIENDIFNDFPDRFKSLQRYATLRSNFGDFQPGDQKTWSSLSRAFTGIQDCHLINISQVFDKMKEKIDKVKEKQNNSMIYILNSTQVVDCFDENGSDVKTDKREIHSVDKMNKSFSVLTNQ
jgi:hypothetical protein